MKKYLEQPFGYLKMKSGDDYSPETIQNWYKARTFVLYRLSEFAFKPDEKNHLHVIVNGDSVLMLSVVRYLALYAHFLNFDEENKQGRTVITIVSSNVDELYDKLKEEEFLNNLMCYCKYTLDEKSWNEDSYIDVELNLVSQKPEINKDNPFDIVITEDEVLSYCNSKMDDEIYRIDTRKAQYAGRMYDLGVPIDNLPSENIHDAQRYTMALDIFQFQKLQEPVDTLIDETKWESDQIEVKNALSNLFCADCFELRARSIELCRGKTKKTDAELWAEYNEPLCKSEHARWIVEKLIMGFRPLNDDERHEDEILAPYKKKRKAYRNGLKKDAKKMAHIDLCSYNDLRRTNPDDMKYDSFLMLAIPKILERIKQES